MGCGSRSARLESNKEETQMNNEQITPVTGNGFAVARRENGARGSNGTRATRFEGKAGAPWYLNPAWWIAGAVVYLAWRKK